MDYLKKSKGESLFDGINVLLMVGLAFVTLYPMIYVAFSSVSDPALLMQHRGLLLKPLNFTLKAYELVFKNPMIVKGYLNTLFILVIGVSVNVLMTAMGAYVLSRKDVLWKKVLMIFIIITMFIEGGMIPFYLTVRGLGLLNSRWAVILPFMINTYNLIIMRTGFEAIPYSLEESAKLDGARHFTILWKIILPLSKPIIAVMILYYGVEIWNSWFWASTFIRDRSLYPIQVILREILIQNDTSLMSGSAGVANKQGVAETVKYATIMVTTLPILLVYPFLQKYFVKGVMIGAVKQ